MNQKTKSYWRGGARGKVSLIGSESMLKLSVRGGRLSNFTAIGPARGHLLLGAGCQATPGDLWKETSRRGSSTWGLSQMLASLVRIRENIYSSMGELS